MLEGKQCVFKRPLPSPCEEEHWNFVVYSELRSNRHPLGKRPLDEEAKNLCLVEEESEQQQRDQRNNNSNKSPKRSNYSSPCSSEEEEQEEEEEEEDEEEGGNNNNNNNKNNTNNTNNNSLLINFLGRDITINCLLRCSRSDYGTLAFVNRGFRSLIRGGELYRLRRLGGIVEHWVYFSCNIREWDAFDPHRRRWMRLPKMPPNECFMCSDKESLAVGTDLLVFGREVLSHLVMRYSILTNSWSPGVLMNLPRCLFGSASLGEKAIVAGGCGPLGCAYASAELYNSETQTWENLPDMNVPRRMCSGVFMDGKFYVIGGTNDSGPLSCGEEYDLETRRWRVIPNMFPFPLPTGAASAPPLVAVVNDELYSADHAEMDLRKYDKKNNLWVTLGKLPERSVSMNGWGLAFRACGERLIVIGGPRVPAGGIIQLNSWIPRDGPPEWELIAQKPSGSFVYNCAVMGC